MTTESKERRKRTSGLGSAFTTYCQQNAGRLLTIDELLSVKPNLRREQVSSAMNNLVNRELLPGLTPGKARGTWRFDPAPTGKAAPADDNLGAAIVDIVAVDQEGKYIGVDKDNGRVFKMERIA